MFLGNLTNCNDYLICLLNASGLPVDVASKTTNMGSIFRVLLGLFFAGVI